MPGDCRLLQPCRLLLATETIQPVALLPGTGQLLRLSLNGEVDQQRTQILKLLAINCCAVEAGSTGKTISLLSFPLPADQQFILGIKSRFHQPVVQNIIELKTGFDPGTLAPTAEQTNTCCALSTTQNSIQSIEKDGFSGTCLTGEHCEASTELKLDLVDQGNVLQLQTGEHNKPGDESDRSGDMVRLEGGA